MIEGIKRKPEVQRYLWRIVLALVLYLTTLFACEVLIEERGLSGVPAFALAALPGLSFASIFWIYTRLVFEETDEFVRLLYIRMGMVATGLTLTVAGVWGFYEVYLPVIHIQAFWWPTLWCVGLGIGTIFNKVTMGTWG